MERLLTFTQSELEALLVKAANLGAEQFYRRARDPLRDRPLTKQQAADYLSVSVPTIDRWMRLGLPYEKRTPKAHPRFYKTQLDQWQTSINDTKAGR